MLAFFKSVINLTSFLFKSNLCIPKLIYYIKIKININTRTSQSAEALEAPGGLFSAKFKATPNELHQEKTQLRWYKDILLTGNC